MGDSQELARLAHRFAQRENGAFVAILDHRNRVVSYAEAKPGEWERYRSNPNNSRDYAIAEREVKVYDETDGFTNSSNNNEARVLGKVLIGDSTANLRASQKRQTIRACIAAMVMAITAVPLALVLFQFWVRRLKSFAYRQ